MSTLLRSFTPSAATSGGGSVGAPFTDPDSVYTVRDDGTDLGIDRVSGGGDYKSPLLLPDTLPGVMVAALCAPGRSAEVVFKWTQPGDASTRTSVSAAVNTGGSFALVANASGGGSYLTGTGASSGAFPARNAPTWVVAILKQVDSTHVAIYADIRDAATPDVILLDGSSNPIRIAINTADGPAGSGIVGQAGLIEPYTNTPAVRGIRLWSYDGAITPGLGAAAGATNIPSLASLLVAGSLTVRDARPTVVYFGIDLSDTGVQTSGGSGSIGYQLQTSAVSDKTGAASGNYADVSGATGKTPSVAVPAGGRYYRAKLTDSGVTPQVAYSPEIFAAPGVACPVTGILALGDSYTANGSPPWVSTVRRIIRNASRLGACPLRNAAIPFTQIEDWVPGHAGPLHPDFTTSNFDTAIVGTIRAIEAGDDINTVFLLWDFNDASNGVTPQIYKDNLNFLLNGYDPGTGGIPSYWQSRGNSTLALSGPDSATGYGPFATGAARPGLLAMGWVDRVVIVKPPYVQISFVDANKIQGYHAKIDELVAENPGGRVLAVDEAGFQMVGGTPAWLPPDAHMTQDGWDAMGERIAVDLLAQLSPSDGTPGEIDDVTANQIIAGVAAAVLADPARKLSSPEAGAVAAGSTGSAVVVSGLPPGKTYPGQRLYHAPSGEARKIASQSFASGNYTFTFAGTPSASDATSGPFSSVAEGDAVVPIP